MMISTLCQNFSIYLNPLKKVKLEKKNDQKYTSYHCLRRKKCLFTMNFKKKIKTSIFDSFILIKNFMQFDEVFIASKYILLCIKINIVAKTLKQRFILNV